MSRSSRVKMGRDEDLAGRKEGVLKGTETTSDGTQGGRRCWEFGLSGT